MSGKTTFTRRAALVGAMAGALSMALGMPVLAQQDYPNRPIRMVIPYTPGGSIDTVGRLVAEQLQKQLGHPFVVENRPGASGMIGSKVVAEAQADGYTLLFNASSQVQLPYVVAKPPYDARRDFTPISQVGYVPLIVVTNKDFPASDLREFATLARENPGKYAWATSGLGTTSHIAEEIIRHEMGLDMEIIAYRGAAPQLTDVMGGHVAAAVSPMPGAMPFVQGGGLKILAVTSKSPLPQLPGVPTVAESGIPDFELLSWYGFWGPPGLPAEIATRLADEVAKAVTVPSVQARFADLAFEAVGSSPDAFERVIDEEIEKIRKVVEQTGIRVD